MMITKVFGKIPSGERLEACTKSYHYREGKFQNIEPTSVMRDNVSMFKLFRDFFGKPKSVTPAKEIPFVQTNLLHLDSDKPSIVWFGHSSYLIQSGGINILVDPVFSGHASPFTFFGKSFPGTDNYRVEDFPPIDILLITHDHYDHLDYATILALHPKVNKIVTSLGVGAHLEFWGIEKSKIVELDWWERQAIQAGIEMTAAPARHFSGRGLTRAKTAWSSFVLEIHGYRLFLGGDSGYDAQFKTIGEKYNGFDLAFLECGQYGVDWPNIHMLPEETLKASMDLRAKVLLPVHWAKFALSTHAWNEPPQRLLAAAQKEDQALVIPMIGQIYTLGDHFQQANWWELED